MKRIDLPPQDYLLSRLDYRDGKLFWRETGQIAGWKAKRYWSLEIDGISYLSHRIIWCMVYGTCPIMIDHADGDSFNNTIENLRDCTSTQNNRNARRWGKKPLPKGVSARPYRDGFRAQVQGKSVFLGNYDTADDAHLAYLNAAAEYFGEFARAA